MTAAATAEAVAAFERAFAVVDARRAARELTDDVARYYDVSVPPSLFPPPDPTPDLEGPFSFWMDEEPGSARAAELVPLNLGARFRSSRDGIVTGVRWFSVDVGGGDLSNAGDVGIYNAAGVLLSQADPALPTSAGWHTTMLATPVPITAGNEFWVVAWLDHGTTYAYAALVNFPTVYEPIKAVGAGFVLADSLTFPTTLHTSLYGVDVIAMTEPT